MIEKIISWWDLHRPSKRKLIQLYSALLYNAHLKGFITGQIYQGKLKALCVPGFNCYSCPGAVGACPLGSLQASLSASGKQAGFYIMGIFLLYGLIAGRTICGWFCPLGLIQELLHKIPTYKVKKSRVTRILSYLKYIFLAVFVILITLWYAFKHSMAVPAFCKYICPAGTFEGAIGLLSNPKNAGYFGMLGIYFTRKFVIMLIIAALCIFIYRAFCRFICPLGAIYGMFNKLSLIGVKVDMDRCSGCGACVRSCKMDVQRVGDHECIHCGHCIETCGKKAVSLKAGSFTLIAHSGDEENNKNDVVQKRRKLEKYAWITAGVLLALIILIVNLTGTSKKKQDKPETQKAVLSGNETETETDADEETAYESEALAGYEPGCQLEDFTAKCYDGTTFNLRENKGKVVMINLWATWCGPCVKELPVFNDFYNAHRSDTVVIACHSSYAPDDVAQFLSDKGWDIAFTIDDEENRIFEKTNGSGVLPQTIVLNRKGEVIYNEIRSVTPELLEQLYEKASDSPDMEYIGNEEQTDPSPVTETHAETFSSDTGDSAGSGTGYDEGEVLEDFSVMCLDRSVFRLSDDPDKVTVIGLWASYSEDSIEELKVINEFAKDHPDEVRVLALHNHFGSKNAQECIKDIDIPVAVDGEEEEIFKLLGASTAVPRIVILDKDRTVISNKRGFLKKEELEELVSKTPQQR